jgi:transcriptional regulator with XRE-family HTH domain
MSTFGRRIRDLRAAKNYSLRALAPMVGVGFTYLSNVERGKLDFGEFPSASRLIQRLASALDADEEELLLLSHRVPESNFKTNSCAARRVSRTFPVQFLND